MNTCTCGTGNGWVWCCLTFALRVTRGERLRARSPLQLLHANDYCKHICRGNGAKRESLLIEAFSLTSFTTGVHIHVTTRNNPT
jgi:hypothetical protein